LHGYVFPEDLEILYKNACLFIYPTLNEGFGYPPLEAMKYGTLCACSANSAITEICGDAVLYFNPFDEIEIGIRVLQSFDEEIRKEKAVKMTARYQLISKKQEHDLDLLVEDIIC
jgi:glycosyltransferase involved in cell wall biosynthesis